MPASGLRCRHEINHHGSGGLFRVVHPAMAYTARLEHGVTCLALDPSLPGAVLAHFDQVAAEDVGDAGAALVFMPGHGSAWGDGDPPRAQHPSLQVCKLLGEIHAAKGLHRHLRGAGWCIT